MEKRIAILATNGFEESELKSPKEAMENEGFKVEIISLEEGKIKSWDNGDWSSKYKVDKTVDQANPDDYDCLVLPGGVINPDKLRTHDNVLKFVKTFFEQSKPVAAICHGPWTLINAEVVKGRKMTSYHTLRKDLENAGANWVDEEVVVDNGLITSRNPDDLPAFNSKLIEEIYEGRHQKQHA